MPCSLFYDSSLVTKCLIMYFSGCTWLSFSLVLSSSRKEKAQGDLSGRSDFSPKERMDYRGLAQPTILQELSKSCASSKTLLETSWYELDRRRWFSEHRQTVCLCQQDVPGTSCGSDSICTSHREDWRASSGLLWGMWLQYSTGALEHTGPWRGESCSQFWRLEHELFDMKHLTPLSYSKLMLSCISDAFGSFQRIFLHVLFKD